MEGELKIVVALFEFWQRINIVGLERVAVSGIGIE
jgi:hypothetical protein